MDFKLPSIHFFTGPFCLRHLDMVFWILKGFMNRSYRPQCKYFEATAASTALDEHHWCHRKRFKRTVTVCCMDKWLEWRKWHDHQRTREMEREKESAMCKRRRCRGNTEESSHGSQLTNWCCQKTCVHNIQNSPAHSQIKSLRCTFLSAFRAII